MFHQSISRRLFLKSSGTVGLSLFLPILTIRNGRCTSSSIKSNPICIFSKPLDWLSIDDLGKYVKELGFDGIDLTVRKGGHIEPEEVEHLLPMAVEKFAKTGISVPMIATDLNDPDNPVTEQVLKTASQCGIKLYRIIYYYYEDGLSIEQNLEKLKPKVARLAQLNEKYKIHGAYQNHDGERVGSSMWDIWYLIKDLDPKWIGIQFDIRHAVVEGTSWRNDFKLVKNFIKCTALKDVHWTKNQSGKWFLKDVPIGEGMIDFEQFFTLYKECGLKGPISIHIPYEIINSEDRRPGKTEMMLTAKKTLIKDLDKVRGYLKKSQLPE